MRVLVACEFSGVVRDAFIRHGHDAVSCDFLPSERPGPHIQDDVLKHLTDGWDMMIAHPPCTHLAVSGAAWFKYKQKEQAEALEFVKKLLQFLKNKKEDVIEKKQFDYLFYQVIKTHSLKDFAALNFVQNSKKFAVNPFGDFGLTEWREILPKTVRDKSYLVLKKKREPMHFREIAQEINKTKFDIRRAHPQTVHNELIKDPRFVLVGRGLYSLREFGIIPGTTREILKKILKAKGPLPLNKVVEMVSQQRVLKHNTILLNLANRKHFKKSPDGMYRVA